MRTPGGLRHEPADQLRARSPARRRAHTTTASTTSGRSSACARILPRLRPPKQGPPLASRGGSDRLRRSMGAVETLRSAFFRSFFRLLILFIGIAEWATAAWVLWALGVRVPVLVHVVAPLVVLALNRLVIQHARRLSRRPLPRSPSGSTSPSRSRRSSAACSSASRRCPWIVAWLAGARAGSAGLLLGR